MAFWDTAIHILKDFVSLTLEVIPYFLFGAVFGAVLQTYLKKGSAFKYLSRGNSSVINASILGAVLPGCACATMPMADGLKRQGGNLGTVTAFIMMSPLLSPITIAMTYGMLGWKITAARMVFPFIGSIVVGVILNYLEKSGVSKFSISTSDRKIIQVLPVKGNPVSPSSCRVEAEQSFWGSLISIIRGLSKYFLIGMLVASVLTTVIPEDSISKYVIFSGFAAYLAAAMVGIPLYVCEGEEVPITFALLEAGLGVGPAFTFLLGSVGTCIPTMIMAQKIIGKRATVFYVVSWFVFAIGSGWLLNLIIR
ncbi:MAG TPA: permease [Thermodesulfobacteriota bacterium]|nr:permease [Thermodesulfobacteriota bacterium]